jgi:hypothetical protein
MAAITYTITNLSTVSAATIKNFTIATTLTQQQHFLDLTGWLPPFNSYTAFTGASTQRTETKTFVDGQFDETAITTATTPTTSTTIFVDSNVGIGIGWAVSGLGITTGTVVSSTPGSNRVVISEFPDDPIPSATQLLFAPPEYLIEVNNTTNLEVGWALSGNGFGSGSISILDIRPGNTLEISDKPPGTPTPGLNITFLSDDDTMLVIPAQSSATFKMNYTRVTSSYGTYTSLVNISAELDGPVGLPINNYMLISAAPVLDPASPFWDGGGGGGDVGPPCADPSSVSCSAECFTADTLVTMADGSKKRIADIKEGDLVQGQGGVNRVLKLLTFIVDTNRLHGFNGSEPFVTACHPIRTDKGWAAFDVEYLKKQWPGDWLMLIEANKGPVTTIEEDAQIAFWKDGAESYEPLHDHKSIEVPKDFVVYNLMLDNDHTFVANDVIVHNKGECFTGDTMINMSGGTLKRIDQIQIGDLVIDALTGKPNKVIGVKVTNYEAGRRLFATKKGVKPFITEQHAFYNENNELCAMSEECEYLAPWLGPVKIVDVPEIETAQENILVYNLMFKDGNSHYANGVPVSNMVGHGGTYVLFQKGYISEEDYKGYIYHLENTVGLNSLTQSQKAKVFRIIFAATKYILNNNNLRSRLLANALGWAIKNRTTLYPYLEKWFKSRIRNWIFK